MKDEEILTVAREELLLGFELQDWEHTEELREQIMRCELPRYCAIGKHLAGSRLDAATGDCLEIGSGYASLLRTLARLFPQSSWHAVEHPSQPFIKDQRFLARLGEVGCELAICDLSHGPLPYADESFSFVCFSEVLEHLPMEATCPLMREIDRVLKPGGFVSVSSPNQAGFLNRVHLLRGKSILSLPVPIAQSPGVYGHVRLYTVAEMKCLAEMTGWKTVSAHCESRNWPQLEGRGSSRAVVYRSLHWLERIAGLFFWNLGDTWYFLFQKPPMTRSE